MNEAQEMDRESRRREGRGGEDRDEERDEDTDAGDDMRQIQERITRLFWLS